MRNLIRFLAVENLKKTFYTKQFLYFVMIVVISERTTIVVHTPHKTTLKKKTTLINGSYLKTHNY